MDVEPAQVEAALARIKPQIEASDFELVSRLWGTLTMVIGLVRAQRATIARLRRFFGFPSSEKTRDVLGPSGSDDDAGRSASPDAGTGDPKVDGPAADPDKAKAKGHGRLAASDYPAAQQIDVPHASLHLGCVCPGCGRGTLYELKEPARILRLIGQPILTALCWNCQRLRCGSCGHVYTAQAPEQAQGPKFDETAVSMLALCRYGAGLPLHRLERLQRNLQTPVSSSTQWDALDQSAPTVRPVFEQLEREAAQAEVVHDDDTYVRILAFMGERRARLLKEGQLPDPDRTGLFTTAIVSITEQGPIALFYSGRKHAGENLAKLLSARDPTLEPPILMSDALSRNLPKGHAVNESNCLAHGRRGIVDQFPNFPAECRNVLEWLRTAFGVEALCKEHRLSPAQRLLVHQRESQPAMDALHTWMKQQLEQKQVEPNSGLGKAYEYMLKRWDKLTLFLRQPGAPLDNNICERALKMAISQRRNSLFYRTQHGASVGDMYTSIIHTAELHGQNPFDYLTQVQRHARAAAERPQDWLPWTYRATLATSGDA